MTRRELLLGISAAGSAVAATLPALHYVGRTPPKAPLLPVGKWFVFEARLSKAGTTYFVNGELLYTQSPAPQSAPRTRHWVSLKDEVLFHGGCTAKFSPSCPVQVCTADYLRERLQSVLSLVRTQALSFQPTERIFRRKDDPDRDREPELLISDVWQAA